MAGKINNRFVSGIVDGPDTTKVRPLNWNDSLVISEGIDGEVVRRDTAAADGWRFTSQLSGFTLDDPILHLQDIADPASDRTRFWLQDTGGEIRYWDDAATPVKRFLVDTALTQTLSNKTLSVPVIADFSSAGHNHQNVAGGGTLVLAVLTDHNRANHDSLGTGAVVFTDETQTLTAKTLTTPTIGDFTNAQHNHQTAAGGSVLTLAALSDHNRANHDSLGTGAVVFTGETQTLTSKTLTTPTIGNFTNAGHNHQNAAGGGTLSITAATTGTLTVARGGTGVTSLTNRAVLLGGGSGVIRPVVGLGSAGQVLMSNGAASDPTFQTVVTGLPRSYLTGLGLSNNGVDANHDIDIAVGEARSGDDTEDMAQGTAGLTKRIDAAWSVGDGGGGLDTGAVAADSWYHVWLIKRTDTDVVDALFSLSATSPTMPASYDKKRRIGAVLTDGAANIIAFSQLGDEFLWDDPPLDINASTSSTSAILRTLSVPSGVQVGVKLITHLQISAFNMNCYLSSPDVNDEPPSGTDAPLSTVHTSNPDFDTEQIVLARTNTSSQIRSRMSNANTVTLRIVTLGWVDRRGRDA